MEDVVRFVGVLALFWLTLSTALTLAAGPLRVLKSTGILRLGRRVLRLVGRGVVAGTRALRHRRRRRVRRDLFGGSVGGP